MIKFPMLMILVIASSSIAFAQQLRGKVVDVDNKPIPFSSISYNKHQKWTSSDADGLFELQLFEDTLHISSIGFYSKSIYIKKNSENVTVVLEKKPQVLKEVVINSRAKSSRRGKIELGHLQSKWGFAEQPTLHLQIAVFIPNKDGIEGNIDAISFQLRERKNIPLVLKIRILSVHPETGLPHEDLLLSNNIIHAYEFKRNNRFSIKEEAVEMLKEGVYVSFEWLPLKNDINVPNKVMPFLLGNIEADKNYVYYNFKEKKWLPSKSKYEKGYAVPNVSITVSY